MEDKLPDLEYIHAYLEGQLTTEERLAFEGRMASDPVLRAEVDLQKDLVHRIERQGLREELEAAHHEHLNSSPGRWYSKSWWPLGLAATLFLGIGVWFIWPSENKHLASSDHVPQVALKLENERAPTMETVIQEEEEDFPTKTPSSPDEVLTTNASFVTPVPEKVVKAPAIAGAIFSSPTTGASISVPPNALVNAQGQAVKGEVTINFREYQNPSHVIQDHIPMTYEANGHQYSLRSAGMFELKISQNGAPVYLRPEAQVQVNYPFNLQKPGYEFFHYSKKEKSWAPIPREELLLPKIEDPTLPGFSPYVDLEGVSDTLKAMERANELATLFLKNPEVNFSASNNFDQTPYVERFYGNGYINGIRRQDLPPGNQARTIRLIRTSGEKKGYIPIKFVNRDQNHVEMAAIEATTWMIPTDQVGISFLPSLLEGSWADLSLDYRRDTKQFHVRLKGANDEIRFPMEPIFPDDKRMSAKERDTQSQILMMNYNKMLRDRLRKLDEQLKEETHRRELDQQVRNQQFFEFAKIMFLDSTVLGEAIKTQEEQPTTWTWPRFLVEFHRSQPGHLEGVWADRKVLFGKGNFAIRGMIKGLYSFHQKFNKPAQEDDEIAKDGHIRLSLSQLGLFNFDRKQKMKQPESGMITLTGRGPLEERNIACMALVDLSTGLVLPIQERMAFWDTAEHYQLVLLSDNGAYYTLDTPIHDPRSLKIDLKDMAPIDPNARLYRFLISELSNS